MVGGTGFEPLTPSVCRQCSTTELTALVAGAAAGSLNENSVDFLGLAPARYIGWACIPPAGVKAGSETSLRRRTLS